jgi:hypothetical protein
MLAVGELNLEQLLTWRPAVRMRSVAGGHKW